MPEKKINWTEQQKLAITQRDSDILVTASAGTGKTAVLSGRCVGIVSDKFACPDVLSMLVLTFTNAAAEQMRSRIAEQLQDAIDQAKDPTIQKHLRQQLMLLHGADIGTIHSFCKKLITQHFYRLGIDPTFSVIEADEQRLLKAQSLEQTIDWAWEQPGLAQAFSQLLELRDLRTDEGFLSRIIDISDYLDGVVGRQNWYERAAKLAETLNPFATELGDKQKQIITGKMRRILGCIHFAQSVYRGENAKGGWANSWEIKLTGYIAKCIKLSESGDWSKCAAWILNFEKPTIFTPKDIDGTIAKLVKDIVKDVVDEFEELTNLAILNPEYLNVIGGTAGLQTKVLIELAKKFDSLYRQAKDAINCMDFADLEHYALKLLAKDDSLEQGQPLPSDTALSLRQKYKYILVDEYQDINYVQKAILDLLSSPGNIFVVGDVKQSIYAFRGAEPKIFVENLAAASPDPKKADKGLRVDLNANFRSDKQILDFVNKVFSKVMTASLGDVDYDESAKLRPASTDETKRYPAVEFLILDEQGKEKQQDKNGGDNGDENRMAYADRQHQALLIAKRIRQMVGADTGNAEFQVFDKKLNCRRDVKYGDIVVLMRSLSKKANDYVEIFQLADIPVDCDAATGYFEKTEIRDIVSLLKILDNPIRDIELAAVLRSPIFKVTDSELAKIRMYRNGDEQKKTFYDCVMEYGKSGPEKSLADKLTEIMVCLEDWRTIARRGELADLIWEIYRQTNYLAFVLALPNGRQRKANLLKLHKRAIQFGQFASTRGATSLSRFVEFIERLQQAGQEFGSPEPPPQSESAVRILSVHKSKGLEFPVVFLAELDSQFNKTDTTQDFLADTDCTLGLRIIDSKSKGKIATLAHQVIAEHKRSANLAEEMRILYVAMTRARQRLILTAAEKADRCKNILIKGIFFDKTVADWQLRCANNHLEWILLGLSDLKLLHDKFGTGLSQKAKADDLFKLSIYGQPEIDDLAQHLEKLRKNKLTMHKVASKGSDEKAAQLLSQVKNSLAWRYEFADIVLLPAKRSVTQLTHHTDEHIKIDYSFSLQRQPKAVSAEKEVESRLVGTAVHLVMANLNLTAPVTESAVEKMKEKLVTEGKISRPIVDCVNAKSIIKFFDTEPGKAVLAAQPVFREWPFTYAAAAGSMLTNDQRLATNDEIVVIQGIIDLLAVTKDGLIVVDFKTDRISAKQVAERAENYREQLNLYGMAAQAVLKTKLVGKWLYFLAPQVACCV